MPSSVAEAAKEDMWLSVIFGGLLVLFSFMVSAKLSQYFPKNTSIEYHRILLGPVLGQVVNSLLLLLMLGGSLLALRGFAMSIKTFVLDITPPQMIFSVLLFLAVYAVQYGLAPILRLQQFIFAPNYCMLIPLLMLGLLSINTKNYQPTLAEGFTPVLQGAMSSWFSYSGSEMITGLIYPFVTRKKFVIKFGVIGILAIIALYTLITLIVQGILGPSEAAYMLNPTVIAYRSVEIPDTFIERLDGYLMIGLIPIYFTSLVNLLYFIAFGTGQLLKMENSRPITVLLIPIIYYLALVPPDLNVVMALGKFYNIIGIVWGLGILPVLLCIAWLKEKRQRTC